MRYKRRYFCVELTIDKYSQVKNKFYLHQLNYTLIIETLKNAIVKYYGDYGAATMLPSFSLMYFNSYTNLMIMRTSREMYKELLRMLTLIKRVDKFNINLNVIHISGSVRQCKKYLVKYCSRRLSQIQKQKKENESNKLVGEVLEKILNACDTIDNDFNLNSE
jgi:RNase P/RNase MRP subunit POP5